jgi:hypothetical protein
MAAPTLVDLSPDEGKKRYAALTDEQKRAAMALKRAGRSPSDAVQIVEAQADAYEAQQPTAEEKIAAAATGAGDSLSLGLADEGAGVLAALAAPWRGLLNPIDEYKRGRNEQRAGTEKLKERAPEQYGGGEIAATLASALVPAKAGANAATAAPSLGKAVGQGVKTGAAVGGGAGAASGFGHSEGDAFDQLVDTLVGGGIGAVGGGIAGGAGAVAPRIAKAAGSVKDKALAALRGKGELAGDIAEALPVVGKPIGVVRKAMKPNDVTPDMIVDELPAKAPPPPKPLEVADDMVIEQQLADAGGESIPLARPPRAPVDEARIRFTEPVDDVPIAPDEIDSFGSLDDWQSFANQTPATRTPRPDLDEAVKVLETRTRADRTPVPRAPSSAQAEPTKWYAPAQITEKMGGSRAQAMRTRPDLSVEELNAEMGGIPLNEARPETTRVMQRGEQRGANKQDRSARAEALERLKQKAPEAPPEEGAASVGDVKRLVDAAVGNSLRAGKLKSTEARSGEQLRNAVQKLLTQEPQLAKSPEVVAKRLGIPVGQARALVSGALFGL